jgi:hypothetical protein
MTTTVGHQVLAWRTQAGIPEDGGMDRRIDYLDIGGLRLPILNIAARKAAIPYHDQAHVVSGYGTDWRGEMEESAFEIAMGCGPLWFAWLINLQGLAVGMISMPRRTLAAWRRGARTHDSLYAHGPDHFRDLEIGAARRALGVAPDPGALAPGDAARLAAHLLAAAAVVLLPLLGALAAAAVGLAWALGA